MMTVQYAWSKLKEFLWEKESSRYTPETIAECSNCYVFSIRLKSDKPGTSTGINPYIVDKFSGKVINDTELKVINTITPLRMINPEKIR